jgi:hypothetical protein
MYCSGDKTLLVITIMTTVGLKGTLHQALL